MLHKVKVRYILLSGIICTEQKLGLLTGLTVVIMLPTAEVSYHVSTTTSIISASTHNSENLSRRNALSVGLSLLLLCTALIFLSCFWPCVQRLWQKLCHFRKCCNYGQDDSEHVPAAVNFSDCEHLRVRVCEEPLFTRVQLVLTKPHALCPVPESADEDVHQDEVFCA